VQQALQKAFLSMRELAEVAYKSQTDAFAVVSQRAQENIQEVKGLLHRKNERNPDDLESVTGIEIRDVDLDGQRLRAGIRRARDSTTHCCIQCIGANLELVQPFVEALEGVEVVVFDVPGVGGSPAPTLPYGSRRWPGSPTS